MIQVMIMMILIRIILEIDLEISTSEASKTILEIQTGETGSIMIQIITRGMIVMRMKKELRVLKKSFRIINIIFMYF
jgi:hypothetical protein